MDTGQSRFNNRPSKTMTTREATELLGIKAATLYTYVSRGLIRSVPSPTDSRRKLYLRTDVERLKARHDARAGHAAAASEALQWGQPVIDTAISHISSEGPLYRGRSAAELAYAGVGFEAVAEWLWAETPPLQRTVWPSPPHTSTLVEALGLHVQPGEDFLSVLMGAVSLAGLADVGRHGAPPEADMARARSLIRRLPAWLSLAVGPERYTAALQAKSVAGSFATALGRSSPEVEAGIERALIVCADHELNASSFAARVAASTGADLYACVGAGLAALSGPRHGRVSLRVEALVREVGSPEAASRAIRRRLQRGEPIDGFGHPLYPEGDRRFDLLMETARAMGPERDTVRILVAVCEAMADAGYPPPTLDVGLVALAGALDLPDGAASALFGVGRSAGWVAHIFEQRTMGYIRPRARYVGH